jgi:hypothetical protein
MANVASAVVIIVVANVALRPIRSPSIPKTRPPTGRITKVAASMANAASSDEVPPAGKTPLKVGTRKAKISKSYHSIRLLTEVPPMVRLILDGFTTLISSGE